MWGHFVGDLGWPISQSGPVSGKLGQMRLDGRTERRVTKAIPVCLVTVGNLHVAEQVVTVNLSPHGARVKTGRRWHPDERPRLASRSGKLLTHTRIVYCQPLSDGNFCIGLKFQSPLPEYES